jgi:4,5-dihydroxyphthalate decarboxylase
VSSVRMSLACWDYDRVRPLQDGRVRVSGVDLTFISLRVEEIFFRMLRHKEFDAAEMSLSSYVLTLREQPPPFVAIPAFPSKSFRHSGIFVHENAGISEPADLAGKTVGVPEYQMTAGVWIRGMLADEHGVPVDSIRYRTGGLEEPGREEKIPLQLPARFDVAPVPADRSLSEMLATGELDAVFSTDPPSCFGSAKGVTRLFADFRAEEEKYYARTSVLPIMHVVVMRREVLERDPWIAQSLYRAFEAAKQLAYADLFELAAPRVMLPWLAAESQRMREVFGDDFWSYGVEANRHTLETFLRYSHEQGIADRRYTADELFAPSTLETWRK